MCRNVWKLTHGTSAPSRATTRPAAFAAGASTRLATFERRSSSPVAVVKTGFFSSVKWSRRWTRSRSASPGDNGRLRRPLLDLRRCLLPS